MAVNFTKISKNQYDSLIEKAKFGSVFIAEIDGNTIKNQDEYLSEIWKAFRFPQTGHINFYAYLDWIRDLDWINEAQFALVIHNFDKLLAQAPKDREIVINSLDKTIIPWWKGEIEHYQVGGKAKPFYVFLVD